jgi:prevent-host-death family protein
MIDITKDIQSLTTFRRQSGDLVKQIKRSKRPVVPTVNGKAAVVVLDAGSYQRLLDIASENSVLEGIRQGLEDVSRGRTKPRSRSLTKFVGGMPYRVELALRASRDLEKLYGQKQVAQHAAAKRCFSGLEDAIDTLALFPRREHFRPVTVANASDSVEAKRPIEAHKGVRSAD